MLDDYYNIFVENKLHEICAPIYVHSNRWNYRCPVCGDSKKNKKKMRANYYPATCSVHCFNCGHNATGLYIVSDYTGMPITDVKQEYVYFNMNFSGDTHVKPKVVPTAKVEPKNINIPLQWGDLTPDLQKYVKNRKIYEAPYCPKNWQLYLDFKRNRLVIPWYRNGSIKFYQNRAITNFQTPKYDSALECEKDIFNYDLIDEDKKYVFALEGAFDAIFVNNGIAIAGIVLTEHQRQIMNNKPNEVVFFPDNQYLDKSGHDETMKLIKNNDSAKVFIWPKNMEYKDVNEYVIKTGDMKLFANYDFLESRVFNGARALLELNF